MTPRVCLGIDPGPIPGMCVLTYSDDGILVNARALQCSANWIDTLIEDELCRDPEEKILLSVERYVPRRGRGKQLAAGANQQTQEMAAGLVARYARRDGVTVVSYTPAQVMPWATEQKLRKVGLWDSTTGCAHARAAAKHALYCACKDGGMPNPLSKANPNAREIIAQAHTAR